MECFATCFDSLALASLGMNTVLNEFKLVVARSVPSCCRSRDIMAQAAQMNVIEINSPIRVEHDKKRRQFSIRLNGSYDKAVLLYEYVGKKTVDLQHTEVPDAYRGRGIAKDLAKAAMDFVVEEDLKAHLTCWYIQKYVKENPHPHYLDHIIH
ncbi:hypothetical protein P4O66_007565 [Electrophorus voltai]|nr:protein NATD1 [Electrophorus electricus]KAK1799323.1 hypothetical protein P4O66_007565 [Electrophorus voltai]